MEYFGLSYLLQSVLIGCQKYQGTRILKLDMQLAMSLRTMNYSLRIHFLTAQASLLQFCPLSNLLVALGQ